jgi:hypothetical protein
MTPGCVSQDKISNRWIGHTPFLNFMSNKFRFYALMAFDTEFGLRRVNFGFQAIEKLPKTQLIFGQRLTFFFFGCFSVDKTIYILKILMKLTKSKNLHINMYHK